MKHVPSSIKDKYDILGVIGEGAYGIVLKARKKDTNTTVAIKHFKQAPGYCTDIDIIERELKILQSLRFENVVELIEWFREKKQCFLVFEYVEWNMLQVLQEHPDGLPIEQVRQLSYQLFSAIYWCHTHEIIHRDIKPENLLISKHFVLKLCDFGFARFCNSANSADNYTDYVATRWYRSPELLIGAPYGKPVDIWACGCIMAELATGQALFAGESDIDQLYRIQKCLGPLPPKYVELMKSNGKFDYKFPPIEHLDTLERRYGHLFPPDIMDLFKGTLRLYASDRLATAECVQHEAFVYLNQKRQQKRIKRQQQARPKTVVGSLTGSQSQFDLNSDLTHFNIPFVDSRLSRWHEETGELSTRRRSPPLNLNHGMENPGEATFATTSSILPQQSKYRSNTQLTDRSSTSHHHHHHRHHHSHHRHHHHHNHYHHSQQQLQSQPQQPQQAQPQQIPHQPKIVRVQSRNHSSSSDERVQPAAMSPMNSNNSSDDDDPNSILSHHSRLRRKYLKSSQAAVTPTPAAPAPIVTPAPSLSRQQSLREQPSPASPTLRYASNGVLLRSKHHHHHYQQQQQQQQQHHASTIFQSSSKDMGQKSKRFSLDTVENRFHSYQAVPNHQTIPESNIYRSGVSLVPSLNAEVYGVSVTPTNLNPNPNSNPNHMNNAGPSTTKPIPYSIPKEESYNEFPQRPKTRDLVRSRTIDCHPTSVQQVEQAANNLQRASSRQTAVYHQMVPDSMEQAEVETMVSNTNPINRSFEQQLNGNHNYYNSSNQINKYHWNSDQRRSVYASDSHLMNSSGHSSSFSRPFFSPTKGDFLLAGKTAMTPQRESTHDLSKSAKASSSKVNTTNYTKTAIDSNRRQQGPSNLLGAYPSARTAILHIANVMTPMSYQRQQSVRLPNTKSRHQDR